MPRKSTKKPASPKAPPPSPEPAPPPPRKKRKLTKYNEFVRDKYSLPEVQAAAVRERLKIIGRMWAEHKNKAQ